MSHVCGSACQGPSAACQPLQVPSALAVEHKPIRGAARRLSRLTASTKASERRPKTSGEAGWNEDQEDHAWLHEDARWGPCTAQLGVVAPHLPQVVLLPACLRPQC